MRHGAETWLMLAQGALRTSIPGFQESLPDLAPQTCMGLIMRRSRLSTLSKTLCLANESVTCRQNIYNARYIAM